MQNTKPDITVILGSRETGNKYLLETVTGISGISALAPDVLSQSRAAVSICTNQDLASGSIRVREWMKLNAALWGMQDDQRIDGLLKWGNLNEVFNSPVNDLSATSLRILNWLVALLPDPEVLVVDDLANGLSAPAKRQLWDLILASQEKWPRSVYYVTPDLEAARSLGDRIWCFEADIFRAAYTRESFPGLLRTIAGFSLTLKSPRAAQRINAEAAGQSYIQKIHLISPAAVEIWVDDSSVLVNLTTLAGFDLLEFQNMPLLGSPLSSWLPSLESASFPAPSIEVPTISKSVSRGRHWKAILQVALAEWRGHFRSFWKAGNLVLSSIYLLTALAGFVEMFRSTAAFFRLAPLFLLFSAALTLGFGMESINLLGAAGEMGSILKPARPVSQSHPLSRLALFDLAPSGRATILTGIGLGQLLILCAHNWPFLLFSWGVRLAFPDVPSLLVTSILFWWLSVLVAFSWTVWCGTRLARPGFAILLGWLAWLLAISSGYWLASWGAPLSWLWPVAGFTAAFQRLSDPPQTLLPFALALVGTACSAWVAWQAFARRRAAWHAQGKSE